MRIVYGICGSGLGHTHRSLAIIEMIMDRMPEARIDVFASNLAHAFLKDRFPAAVDPTLPGVYLHKIDGVRLYHSGQKVNIAQSVVENFRFVRDRTPYESALLRSLITMANVVVSDFEPIVAGVAREIRVPCVSIDHQHIFRFAKFEGLRFDLWLWKVLMGLAVRFHSWECTEYVVSSFFRLNHHTCKFAGPIVGKSIQDATPTTGDRYVSYFGEYLDGKIMCALIDSKIPITLFGAPEEFEVNNLITRKSGDEFKDELIKSRGLIGAAGNQSLSEALVLGKHVLAMPSNQPEQQINGYYLALQNLGWSFPMSALTGRLIREFDVHATSSTVDPIVAGNQIAYNTIVGAAK